MKKQIALLALLGAAIACLAACETSKGVVADARFVLDTGKGLISAEYDPTNGTTVTLPADSFGTIKTYKPALEK